MPRFHARRVLCLTFALAWAGACGGAGDSSGPPPGDSPATPAAGQPAIGERIDRYLAPADAAGLLSGTVLVARGDEVVYERAFGFADRELEVACTPETKHNVASITKPMTLIVAVRMMEAGKLAPGDALAKFIPDFPRAGEITVEHLMRHRAGIPHRVTTPRDETEPRTAAEMVELAKDEPLLFTPGEQSIYSSAGYSVLARVLEIAGGAPYEELLERYLFAPVGMEHSAHADGRTILPGRASSYGHGVGGLVNAPLKDLSFLVGAGSVYSTARDLFLLQRALLRGDLGEGARESLERENGLAWNGASSGFRAFADWHRESDATVILTSNLPSGVHDLLRDALPRIAAGEDVAPIEVPDAAPVRVADDVLHRYEGTFQLRPGRDLEVRAENGGLLIGDWFLLPTGPTSFFSPQDFGRVEVVFGDGGEVEALDWASSAGSLVMPKVGARPR